MNAFLNDNIKDDLCGGCECSDFTPSIDYAYSSTTVTLTDSTTYGSGDSRKIVQLEIRDKNGKSVKSSIAADDGDDAVAVSVASLDPSEGLCVFATVVSANGCISDGHATNIGASGALGSWDKDYDGIIVTPSES